MAGSSKRDPAQELLREPRRYWNNAGLQNWSKLESAKMIPNWTTQRTSPPAALPLSIVEIKQRLNLPTAYVHHDAKLEDLLFAATEQFEADTDRVCLLQTFELLLDQFPLSEPIDLYKRPIQAIDSITYLDRDGAVQTVDPAVYKLSTARRQVYLASGQQWPSVTPARESVVITFQAGEADAERVPREYRQAIALQVGSWFVDPADEKARDKFLTSYHQIIQRLITTKDQ